MESTKVYTDFSKIDELVDMYLKYGNRQTLTILRALVTKILRKNHGMENCMILDIFEKHQLDPRLVGINYL